MRQEALPSLRLDPRFVVLPAIALSKLRYQSGANNSYALHKHLFLGSRFDQVVESFLRILQVVR